jgi:hypothetical protein
MVFDVHDRAFAFSNGTWTRGIYDTRKTAVDTIPVGKERSYDRRFLQMCSHYLVDPVACTPAAAAPARRRGRARRHRGRGAARRGARHQTVVHGATPSGERLLAVLPGQAALAPCARIRLASEPQHLHFFDAEGRRIDQAVDGSSSPACAHTGVHCATLRSGVK